MWWNALIGAVDGYLQGQAHSATAAANNRISAVNAETSNKTRKFKNLAQAATNSLARWSQSLNNQRALTAGGEQLEANKQNFLRGADASAYQDISRSIGEAETMGAQAAQAGAVGALGGVADMVDISTRIRAGIIEEGLERNRDLAYYDNARRAGMIFSQTVQGLDNSLILDAFDWQVDYKYEVPVINKWEEALRGAGRGLGADAGTKADDAGRARAGAAGSSGATSFSSKDTARFRFSDPDADSSEVYLGSARFGQSSSSVSDEWDKRIASFGSYGTSTTQATSNPYSLWGGS